MPSELRKLFDNSKSVVKYVNLKIMGEVLGGLLNRLRSEMTQKIVENSPICEIINESKKKTVCFTTFVGAVKISEEFLKKKCKFNPVTAYGETSHLLKDNLIKFKEDITINPLIATIQTLSTGVTLVEANTIVFLNKTWRFTDQIQAEDRVHRIGQDIDVNIFSLFLDTGSKENLSTRMEEIISWSKEMFEGIVSNK